MAKTLTERKTAEAEIAHRYHLLDPALTERSHRLFAASEAQAFGHGGIAAVARATGLNPLTIRNGIEESKALEAGTSVPLPKDRIRRAGGGRKRLTTKEPALLPALKTLVEASTYGDPMSPLLWTARSQRNLVQAMKDQGYSLAKNTLASLLTTLGYSRQGNKKCLEGSQHPDRNAQFEHINETVRRQLEAGNPAISVDTKKKEWVGNYLNEGEELRPAGCPERVNGHDFEDPKAGKAVPYGVYDLAENEAWVSVGISHDTAEFAVATIRSWWKELGKPLYPQAQSLLIMADCGGSNGYRLRLWKVELQKLVDELGFPITVCHMPTGASKWNKIEHRLFSFITQNWRGKPLITHEVMDNLIASTTTTTGLTVKSRLDPRIYEVGKRITDTELAEVHLVPLDFHGEWNYTIRPSWED